MSKVLGLSFGRKMSNCDVMVKHALTACKEAGHEVRFINIYDLDIKDCTGCIACTVGMIMGKRGDCVLKDDFHILDEAMMEADAIIYGCPTFEMTPTGTFKTVCDRLGPSHDISFRKVAIEEGLAAGIFLSGAAVEADGAGQIILFHIVLQRGDGSGSGSA